MTANPAELQNFLWHCEVAGLLISALPSTTSTNAHVVRAIRGATDAATGAKGIRHASQKAIERQVALGLPWDKCELRQEHSIPVSVLCRQAREALSRLSREEANSDERNVATSIAPGLWSTRALRIADVVLQGAIKAWITEAEDKRLNEKGLVKAMPQGWKAGDDPFARYVACEIFCVEI